MRESASHRESILHPHSIQVSEYIACLCDSQNRRRIAQSHSNTPESLFILWACISLPTSSRIILFTLQSTVPREMSVYIQAIDLNTPQVCIIRFSIGTVGLITPQSNSSAYSIWCFSAAPSCNSQLQINPMERNEYEWTPWSQFHSSFHVRFP